VKARGSLKFGGFLFFGEVMGREMKLHSTNYYNTLIGVAEDCPVNVAEIPPQKNDEKTVALLQYHIIQEHPYTFTSDDVIFNVYAERQSIAKKDYKTEREKFFSKGQPCLRSSPLPKRYGWGVHSNEDGKLALIAVESETYKKLTKDKTVKQIRAMRSRRT
jgi:hypothetical protein